MHPFSLPARPIQAHEGLEPITAVTGREAGGHPGRDTGPSQG